jgi:hypothetical protein
MKKIAMMSGMLAVVVGGAAWAGAKVYNQVTIYATEASGSMGAARNSGDTLQKIGCSVWMESYGPLGMCSATNAAGTSRSCSIGEAWAVDAIQSITDDAHLRFGWDSAGYCTFIYVSVSSSYDVKQR